MSPKIRSLEGGSYLKGNFPTGCKLCRKGAKLFFLVSGKCRENCFYCSLAKGKRGKDIILANERPVTGFSGVMLEVANMNALGAAVTGGDPLATIDLTVDYIQKMKKEFGKKFHIHLYTSGRLATEENLERLFLVGLDEIRFHPQSREQEKAIERALNYQWAVGAEVPVLPDEKKELLRFLEYLEGLERVKFCNLNELEATESNLENLKKRGYELRSDSSSAIAGSEEIALQIMEETELNFSVHFCSAKSKDAVQFRNRLKRTAEIVRKPYEDIEDGMLVKAVFSIPKFNDPEEVIEILIDEYEIEPELIALRDDQKIETSWYIADVLKGVLFERFKVEDVNINVEYPTYGRMMIAQASLREMVEEERKVNGTEDSEKSSFD